jgi:hypothetical protein
VAAELVAVKQVGQAPQDKVTQEALAQTPEAAAAGAQAQQAAMLIMVQAEQDCNGLMVIITQAEVAGPGLHQLVLRHRAVQAAVALVHGTMQLSLLVLQTLAAVAAHHVQILLLLPVVKVVRVLLSLGT